jgi:hypothetical protein
MKVIPLILYGSISHQYLLNCSKIIFTSPLKKVDVNVLM